MTRDSIKKNFVVLGTMLQVVDFSILEDMLSVSIDLDVSRVERMHAC